MTKNINKILLDIFTASSATVRSHPHIYVFIREKEIPEKHVFGQLWIVAPHTPKKKIMGERNEKKALNSIQERERKKLGQLTVQKSFLSSSLLIQNKNISS